MVDALKISILVLGATGQLGSLVTRHALQQPNLIVNILVRDLNKSQDLVTQVKNAGGRVIQGDLNKPETFTDVTKGIHTIISCSTIIQAQDGQAHINLLQDAVKHGVKRFVSPNFGVNYQYVTPGNSLIDAKLTFERELAKTTIKPVIISVGLITDFLLYLNGQALRYYGDINQKIDLTTYDDVARLVATIVADPEQSGAFSFVGEELSTKEIAEIYNRVRGADIKPQNAGSLEELKNQREQKKKDGDEVNAAFLNLFELVYGGRGKIVKTDNSKFSQVKRTSLEEFLTQNTGVKIAA